MIHIRIWLQDKNFFCNGTSGHLNPISVQRIVYSHPFLAAKLSAAAKCDSSGLKCALCKFAKVHGKSKLSKLMTPSMQSQLHPTIGALTRNHMNPGMQVSVNHFESRLVGRTFDSYGKVSSATFKGGCNFVDHSSGYMPVEHQVGFSACETLRTKQSVEHFALSFGVLIQNYCLILDFSKHHL